MMAEPSIKDIFQALEAILKDKPNYNKLPGGSGYRNVTDESRDIRSR